MRVKTKVKAGSLSANHNQSEAKAGLLVETNDKVEGRTLHPN
jgi:hypothetical protein